MEPLPQPPAPQPLDDRFQPRALRAWQLTPAWRTVFAVGWAGVVLGIGAVLKTARTMGLSTWWLGPEADSRIIVIQALPFAIPVLLIICSFRGVRYLPYLGLVATGAMAAIAAGDLGRFRHLALVELTVAAVGLLVTVASFAGMLRPATATDADLDTTDAVAVD
jgi:hypothetical protein